MAALPNSEASRSKIMPASSDMMGTVRDSVRL
ncbi:Uncharacterised protein [Bordetella pertussis]|nr:Uncharacterised protein [Bordetella pertussis]CPM35742.1 Uncharacterised protein [Bordetella pertussis]CPN99705.1 Uncharacterised protein [Bordetella pertussis]